MPTLLIGDNFSRAERLIFPKVFRSNCERLGISNMDFSVHLQKVFLGEPENEQLVYARTSPLEHKVHLLQINTVDWNLFDATSSFGHEMVHVKQSATGELIKTDFGDFWKGQLFSRHVDYKERPWENEAFAKQGELHFYAIKSLPYHEQLLIRPEDSKGLAKFILEYMQSLVMAA